MVRVITVLGVIWGLASAVVAYAAPPPLSDYTARATIRSMELSPDGRQLVFIIRIGGEDYLTVNHLETKEIEHLAKISEIKAGRVEWVNEDWITLVASKTTNQFGYRGKFEFSAAFSFNVESRNIEQLLRKTRNLHPAQSGLGNILAVAPDGETVFMRAFMRDGTSTTNDLLKVDLKDGHGHVIERGNVSTIRWIVSPDRSGLVRIDMRDKANRYSIHSKASGTWKKVYEEDAEYPPFTVSGFTEGYTHLVIIAPNSDAAGSESIGLLDLTTGEISDPQYTREGRDIDATLKDRNNIVRGIKYSGMTPRYKFFDETLDQELADIQNDASMLSLSVVSWSDDWSKILLFASGDITSGAYYLYDRNAKSLTEMARNRPNITSNDIGQVFSIEYKARDGLTIPAVLTWPSHVAEEKRKNLPTIVLPHGGPTSYDNVSFDWMAQYFASQGYLVLQPNFRGSSGFGVAFKKAGFGEWGKAMQDDITDGLAALVDMGWTDPERVCIVGWSYGGYAALVGGAFTPELYNCIVAIAPVSDVRRMIREDKERYGSNDFRINYIEEMVGDSWEDRKALDAVSPANFAENFEAPVLLVHGKDDLIVPVEHSQIMKSALEKAGKTVRYIELKKQGHSLVDPAERQRAFEHVGEFVNTHIGD